MSSQSSRFRVIHGDRQGRPEESESAPPAARRLHTVPPAEYRPAKQLSLPGFAGRPRTVATVSLTSLGFDDLERILRQYSMGTVIDVRLIPSFRRRGFSPDRFFALTSELSITYVHLEDFSSIAARIEVEDLARCEILLAHLERDAIATDVLSRALTRGSVLVVGDSPRHQNSEREVVARFLDKSGTRDLVVF